MGFGLGEGVLVEVVDLAEALADEGDFAPGDGLADAGRAEDLDARGVRGAGGEAHVVDGVVAAEGVADGVCGLRLADEGLAAAEVEEVRGHRHEAADGCRAGLAGVDGEGRAGG